MGCICSRQSPYYTIDTNGEIWATYQGVTEWRYPYHECRGKTQKNALDKLSKLYGDALDFECLNGKPKSGKIEIFPHCRSMWVHNPIFEGKYTEGMYYARVYYF